MNKKPEFTNEGIKSSVNKQTEHRPKSFIAEPTIKRKIDNSKSLMKPYWLNNNIKKK